MTEESGDLVKEKIKKVIGVIVNNIVYLNSSPRINVKVLEDLNFIVTGDKAASWNSGYSNVHGFIVKYKEAFEYFGISSRFDSGFRNIKYKGKYVSFFNEDNGHGPQSTV